MQADNIQQLNYVPSLFTLALYLMKDLHGNLRNW